MVPICNIFSNLLDGIIVCYKMFACAALLECVVQKHKKFLFYNYALCYSFSSSIHMLKMPKLECFFFITLCI